MQGTQPTLTFPDGRSCPIPAEADSTNPEGKKSQLLYCSAIWRCFENETTQNLEIWGISLDPFFPSLNSAGFLPLRAVAAAGASGCDPKAPWKCHLHRSISEGHPAQGLIFPHKVDLAPTQGSAFSPDSLDSAGIAPFPACLHSLLCSGLPSGTSPCSEWSVLHPRAFSRGNSGLDHFILSLLAYRGFFLDLVPVISI